jgi:hypothetical protein
MVECTPAVLNICQSRSNSQILNCNMPGILSLPFELLVEVAKLVPEPIHLTTVCRMLNDVATPVAYRLHRCRRGIIGLTQL